MSAVRIFLFGGVRIEHDGRPTAQKATRVVQALLAYLLLERHRSHARDVLVGLFWGDQSEESARGCLNTALWRLRRVLEPDGVPRGTYVANTAQGEIGFNRASDYWLDVAVFEEHANRVLGRPAGTATEADVEQLEGALALYTSDLIEGIYSDWALCERERLRLVYLRSLTRLMRHHGERNAYEKSLAFGERILRLDPLREEIHREMMRLYLACGQRSQALRQFQTCREILAAELDVAPMEETTAVYDRIVAAGRGARTATAPVETPRPSRSSVATLEAAPNGLHQLRVELERALRLVDTLARVADSQR